MNPLSMTASTAGSSILVTFEDGRSATFAAYWLRDNCHCAQCRHAGNGQKLYQITDLPAALSVRTLSSAKATLLEVVWSDGHLSSYAAGWLADHQLGATARHARQVKPVLWDQRIAADMPVASWPALLADPAKELAWLERYTALGFGLLKDVPITPGAVAEVGDRLGYVRITNYGRLFDVKSVPNPTNLAYTAVALGVHSDNPYRHPSPGVQLLHCLEAEAPG
ncbi:MAG: gamma-butyrobetaine hydroxylase-like domain-containing protein, partial [Burkholderiales bacterium]|nr:gamma-butyrobetaine hydroxylase-like domain-containing protein [Burkholderiales bacterium]